jgi:hypothetical protein
MPHTDGFQDRGSARALVAHLFRWRAHRRAKALVLAHGGQVVERVGHLRPLERRPLMATATVARALDYRIAATVLWTFRAAAPDTSPVEDA